MSNYNKSYDEIKTMMMESKHYSYAESKAVFIERFIYVYTITLTFLTITLFAFFYNTVGNDVFSFLFTDSYGLFILTILAIVLSILVFFGGLAVVFKPFLPTLLLLFSDDCPTLDGKDEPDISNDKQVELDKDSYMIDKLLSVEILKKDSDKESLVSFTLMLIMMSCILIAIWYRIVLNGIVYTPLIIEVCIGIIVSLIFTFTFIKLSLLYFR